MVIIKLLNMNLFCRKRVGNIKGVLGKQYQQSDVRRLEHGSSLETDWEKATTFLTSNRYLWETITGTITTQTAKKGQDQKELVFAHPEGLEVLANHGYLTLFDSSHKLNVFNYNLFSFICRDSMVCGYLGHTVEWSQKAQLFYLPQ